MARATFPIAGKKGFLHVHATVNDVRVKRATAEDLLQKAMLARTTTSRARYAQAGLAFPDLDKTTQAMLLRQLYLCHFERRRFKKAHDLAVQAIRLDVLPDVIHQDAARAAAAAGHLDVAVGHLRTAAKRGPASRRAFHYWTLGSTLFLAHRYREAIAALTFAARAKKNDRALYRAHLALARIAGGEPVLDLESTIEALAASPSGQGYGRFVLGHLLYAAGEWKAATRCLTTFVDKLERGRTAMAIALEGELRMSAATLVKMGNA
jgi:tetratricopeptide (TPR) repeat protein